MIDETKKCAVCGKDHLQSCMEIPTGEILCGECRAVGMLWAARMARNPEKVFDATISSIVTITAIEGLKYGDPKPLIVTGNGGAANAQ